MSSEQIQIGGAVFFFFKAWQKGSQGTEPNLDSVIGTQNYREQVQAKLLTYCNHAAELGFSVGLGHAHTTPHHTS